MTRLLIIIPCYNEQESLPSLLDELVQLDLPVDYVMEVVVINDHSTDKTVEVASKFPVHILNLPVNLGIGGAVQCGLCYATEHGFDLAVQMDGDGQHPPAELIKLLECYQLTGANLVIGSRYLSNEGFQSSFTRRLGIRYFYLLNRLFTGKRIYDSTSGYRLFDRSAIDHASHHYPDDYPEPESLILFAKKKLSISETPVIMRSRNGGKSSISSFAAVFYCVKVTIAMVFSSLRNLN